MYTIYFTWNTWEKSSHAPQFIQNFKVPCNHNNIVWLFEKHNTIEQNSRDAWHHDINVPILPIQDAVLQYLQIRKRLILLLKYKT